MRRKDKFSYEPFLYSQYARIPIIAALSPQYFSDFGRSTGIWISFQNCSIFVRSVELALTPPTRQRVFAWCILDACLTRSVSISVTIPWYPYAISIVSFTESSVWFSILSVISRIAADLIPEKEKSSEPAGSTSGNFGIFV